MGLPLALKAHTQGNLELAKTHYARAIVQNPKDPIIYQNYGALLKTLGLFEDSEKIYLDGQSLFPDHIGINTNFANLYRKYKPVSALQKYKFVLSLHLAQGDSFKSDKVKTILVDIVTISRDLGLKHLSLLLVLRSLCFHPHDPFLLLNLMLLLDDEELITVYRITAVDLRLQLETYLDKVDPLGQLQLLFGLASHELHKSNSLAANKYFDDACACAHRIIVSGDPSNSDKARNLLTINNWNIACTILKFQEFERGWQLYEYGLQTPCEGKQRWQRSLAKPFSSDQVPLWRGEPLNDKSLLLLEEQAIGDVMMFLSLLATILSEAKHVCLFLSDRLIPIYRRTYEAEIRVGKLSVCSKKDYQSGTLVHTNFCFQSPLGSICQYRFKSPVAYAPRVPSLISNNKESKILRSRYLNGDDKLKLIGVSWHGGGKGARITQKSIKESQFFEFLSSISAVRFVSLQYGNVENRVSKWRQKGLDITYDKDINSLRNMDSWLSQVAACDGVLSIANTTIHGAGGLNVPTLCLLSSYADWRWLDHESVSRSYWYPSVGVARESRTSGWDSAFQIARNWISEGCPYPTGPTHL